MAEAQLVNEDCYPKCKYNGYCIIVNNEYFTSPNLKQRLGSSKDAEDLTTLFSDLGFITNRKNNLTKKEVMNLMSSAQHFDYHEMTGLFVILLSHGEKEAIYSTDSEIIHLSDIISYFTAENCPSLFGKPKVFIIQACRDYTDQALTGLKCERDFLIAYATLPGYKATRDTVQGSWYIQVFIQTLKKQPSTEFVDILRIVQANVLEQHPHHDQQPEYRSRLLKRLYLNPTRSRRGSSASIVVSPMPPSPSLSHSSLVLNLTPTTPSIISDKASLVSSGLSRHQSERHSKRTLHSISPSILEDIIINEQSPAVVDDDSSDSDKREEAFPYDHSSQRYKLDEVPCGYCIIINNDDHRHTSVHMDALSTEESVTIQTRDETKRVQFCNLVKLFKEKLGFHVETFVNLSVYAIRQILEAIRNVDHTNLGCFALIILSRGKTNDIYGADTGVLSINEIIDNFSDTKCGSLVRKPKLFFFQTTIENDHSTRSPPELIHPPSDSFLVFINPSHQSHVDISKIVQALEAGYRTDTIGTIFESIEELDSDDIINRLESNFYFCTAELRNDGDYLLCEYKMAYNVWSYIRRNTVDCLLQNKREILKIVKKVRKTRVFGSSVSIAGSVLSGVGLILIPFTLGGSIALTVAGTVIATAGAVTSLGATVDKRVKTNKKLKEAREIIKLDQQLSTNVNELLQELQNKQYAEQLPKVGKEHITHCVANGVKTGSHITTGVAGTVAITVEAVRLGGPFAVKMGGTALRSIAIAGGVLGGVTLLVTVPMDIVEIGYNARGITSKHKDSHASKWLQELIDQLEYDNTTCKTKFDDCLSPPQQYTYPIEEENLIN